MNALILEEYGSVELLKFSKNITQPTINHLTDVIVKVSAAGVTHGDIALCKGIKMVCMEFQMASCSRI
jgi:NADPH:quinone reductase-like Zn-dependent oxidoreductase